MTPYLAHVKAAQYARLKANPLAYGGRLRNTRYGRSRPRPLSTRHSMHLTLRSSRARGPWSLRSPRNFQRINALLVRFTKRYHITVIRMANVGNHLHLHLQLESTAGYYKFIRAFTSAVAMAVTGASRWHKVEGRFWDLRPFTRLVTSLVARHRVNRYIAINELEGQGYGRFNAEMEIIRQDELLALGHGSG